MSQPTPYRRGFNRFTLEPEVGPVEFEMALDIEEQARASELNKLQLRGSWGEIDHNSDKHERGRNGRSTLVLENNPEPLSPRRLSRISPNPEFRFPPESYYKNVTGAEDMDPMKKSPQLSRESIDNHGQPQTPSPGYTSKSGQRYSHHRFISEAESYTAHWENSILYDKDTNTRVSSPSFSQLRSGYRSPYLGPVGWTIPSKYYSMTRRSSRRALNAKEARNGENHISSVDPNTGSPRERVRKRNTPYSCRASRPFLIYQDPEWVAPPRGVTDAYFDSTASDDKENSVPDEIEFAHDGDVLVGERSMEIQVERPTEANGSNGDGDDEMDIDGNEFRITPIRPARQEEPRYRHRRNTSSMSSSSIF
ncbi:hypothetical protein MGYG_03213 [Nannizzia gypsea CBS 118893]|uniref:Uncharacterized protein n=1 Tax=Arthroderma gypseum (strain ATCC MYA-4604 / CBS 118893) TaxID=535722 RepID=E4URK0_ARTGP|nr:hypothetical protein MGYG_03213 [Nannizzia gypsea CBS 118893]EFR00210.1 hypothetical protein MGYG_03213 [Nannizzia gypsea CBS 118893]